MAQGAVRVRGLKELTRDFKRMSRDLSREVDRELKKAAEPVRNAAEQLALSEIRNMPRSPHWAGMRIGVSAARGRVYIVPVARRSGGSGRSNLATLLLDRAMDPAVERHADEVVDGLGEMIDRLAGHNGF